MQNGGREESGPELKARVMDRNGGGMTSDEVITTELRRLGRQTAWDGVVLGRGGG